MSKIVFRRRRRRRQKKLFQIDRLTGNTSVGEFGLTVSLEGVVIGLLGESERIEESNRVKSSDHGVDVRDGLGGRGSRLGSSERREGSGRSGRGDEGGGNELHFDCLDCECFEFAQVWFYETKANANKKTILVEFLRRFPNNSIICRDFLHTFEFPTHLEDV